MVYRAGRAVGLSRRLLPCEREHVVINLKPDPGNRRRVRKFPRQFDEQARLLKTSGINCQSPPPGILLPGRPRSQIPVQERYVQVDCQRLK